MFSLSEKRKETLQMVAIMACMLLLSYFCLWVDNFVGTKEIVAKVLSDIRGSAMTNEDLTQAQQLMCTFYVLPWVSLLTYYLLPDNIIGAIYGMILIGYFLFSCFSFLISNNFVGRVLLEIDRTIIAKEKELCAKNNQIYKGELRD